MKNPLIKRVPRELRHDWHKYLVIVCFMVLMIGLISGMYVGHDSMLEAIYSGREELNLEDGSFEISREASGQFIEDIKKEFNNTRVDIVSNFFKEESEDNNGDGEKDANVRIYLSDAAIDKASVNEGRVPEAADEIAIDRMHADNVGVKTGDTITVGGKDFKIVGLVSYVNYLTLHESNTDLMFDAFGFDVAMVTPEAFDGLDARTHYSYAFAYDEKPGSKTEQADYAEDFLKALVAASQANETAIVDFLPEYLRQASNFAVSDIEGDSSTTSILCYILIAVIAFIFAVTISNTIDREASVIGTLRASGYSKREMVVHYMSMPVIVTVLGAVIGNVLGYTAFKDVAVRLYYNSYSLPNCHAVWSNTALVKTTVIPLLLMFFINLFVIVKKLQLSPLRFLRHDLSRSKKSKAMRLPRWSFLRRFRLRVFFQNIPNYLILMFGVIFIELMMCFAFGLPDSLNHYSEAAPDMMFSKYQYMLMSSRDITGAVIETSEETAEKFIAKDLKYPKERSTFRTGMGSGGDESVTVFGVVDGSGYVSLKNEQDGPSSDKRSDAGSPGSKGAALSTLSGDETVAVSSAFASKFGLEEGDEITLHEEYEDKSYKFKVGGEVDYDGGIAIFMEKGKFDRIFDTDADDFSGYFAQEEITDIDEAYIATVITSEDIMKVTNQLKHSLGGMVDVFKYVLIVLAAALIYLLAKIIIERNEHAISMTKVLGFKNGEIGGLYIVPTAIVVVIFSVIGFVIGMYLMMWIFKVFMLQMDGYFAFFMNKSSMVLSVVYLLIGYAFVSLIDYVRIKKIPLGAALKNIE